jgi:putative tributyrin esterase
LKLALTYPERYAAAASLSGVVDVVRRVRDAAEHDELKGIFGEAGALAGGPNDLFSLAERMVNEGQRRPSLYQWCGTEDFLYVDNVCFRDHTASLGLDVTYEEGRGGHDWSCWDAQIQRVLAWLPGVAGR